MPSLNDISHAVDIGYSLSLSDMDDETKMKAMRVVCGSDACKGAADARVILMALGLIPDPEVDDG